MPTRNLTDHLDRNAGEVVREGLRLMEQRRAEERAKLKWLRGAVRDSLDQIGKGQAIEFDSPLELDRHIGRLARAAAAPIPKKRVG